MALICVVLCHYAVSYNLTCPVQSQRRFRNDFCTDPAESHYSCLLNVLSNTYVETCLDSEFLVPNGIKKIRKPGVTDDNCTETRYQPIPFTTDEFSECMYSKSLCSEEGQVIANNGTNGYQDRSCRCDYRAGYTYIVEPRNICECVPSEEDCSCYRTMCPPGEELSRDYECRKMDGVYLTTCGAITIAITGEGNDDSDATVSLESKSIAESTSVSYTSGGKAAAGLFLLLLFLAVLLIVLLVDFRPHVTEMTVNIDENHVIHRDDNNHVYHVIEGGTMSVDCKIRSRIGVKSVKMVKVSPKRERSYVVVKSVINDRKRLDEISGIWRGESKQLSPTDTGEHRCILTNRLPLPLNNANSLSSKLARSQVLKHLTDFSPFFPETSNRITLHVQKIPSERDFIKGYSGESIKFTAAPDSKRSLLSVQWVRVVQLLPDLKLKSLPQNGSTTYLIENATIGDSGDYICFMTADDQTVQSHGFRLKVLPSESSYDEVLQHREDDTYVQISAVDRAMVKLRKHKIVILKGREGTGKSKMCLEIASRCEDHHQYFPVMVTSKKDIKEEFDNAKVLYILDQSDDMEVDKFKELYKFLLDRTMPSQAWIIIACRSLYGAQVGDETLLDCDSVLSSEEKEEILKVYRKKHNIDIAASAECNYRKKEILDKNDIQVTLDKDAVNQIITTEPLQGFPLMVKKFCEDRKKLHLGEKFFTNPQKEIVDRIVTLRETGIREDDCRSFLMFCILVCLTTEAKNINQKEIKSWYKNFVQVARVFSKFERFNGDLSHIFKESDEKNMQLAVTKIMSKMIGTYLKETGGNYEFIHPYMSKAIFLSSQYFATYGLADCPLEYILEFIRSCKYNNSEEEMVLKIDKEYLHLLCERLMREITIHSEKAKLSEECMIKELEKQAKVCKYIYDEWVKSKDETFCRKLFSYVDGIFSFIRDYEFTLQAWHMLRLINHVTCNGMDPWIYSVQDLPDMAVIFGLISACENRYSINEQKKATFKKLLEILANRLSGSKEDLKKRSQSSVMLTVNDKSALQIDKYGNTLFHYLCLYSEDEPCEIIDKYNEKFRKEYLQMKNNENIQPIHLAVALGKPKIVEKMQYVIGKEMKDNRETKSLLKQILHNVKKVHIEKKDDTNSTAFDIDKNFDPEISGSVFKGSKEDFETVWKLFEEMRFSKSIQSL